MVSGFDYVLSRVPLSHFVAVYRRAKTPEGATKAAVEEHGITPTPKALNLVLATSAQAQGAQAILPERNSSWLRALV